MTCRAIMTIDPPVLRREETVGVALHRLLEHRHLALPVVDGEGIYLGLFAKSGLFGLMLPSIVRFESMLPKLAQLTDLAYLSDDLDDLRHRFDALRDRPVGDFADAAAPRLRPDSPLMEAVLLIYRTRNFVPVVDPESGRLVGVVSTWNILSRIEDRP